MPIEEITKKSYTSKNEYNVTHTTTEFIHDLGESRFSRGKIMTITLNDGDLICDICGKRSSRDIIYDFDTSDGEYGSITICNTCLEKTVAKCKKSLEPKKEVEEDDMA